jgi:hypothetical protein
VRGCSIITDATWQLLWLDSRAADPEWADTECPADVPSDTAGRISMQSTGHGDTHSSQPVHSDEMTVCIHCGAPTIASTGHAFRHKLQPMH